MAIVPTNIAQNADEWAKKCADVWNFKAFTGCYRQYGLKCSWGCNCVKRWDKYNDFGSVSCTDICNKHKKDFEEVKSIFIKSGHTGKACRMACARGYELLSNSNYLPDLANKIKKHKHCCKKLCSR